jgi:hypothetical protein
LSNMALSRDTQCRIISGLSTQNWHYWKKKASHLAFVILDPPQ